MSLMTVAEQYSQLLTIQQVAERLQVSRGSVYNLERAGAFSSIRVLSRRRFRAGTSSGRSGRR
jgi:excisionase family DNA binding protein